MHPRKILIMQKGEATPQIQGMTAASLRGTYSSHQTHCYCTTFSLLVAWTERDLGAEVHFYFVPQADFSLPWKIILFSC